MSTDFDIRCVTCAREGKSWNDRSTGLENFRNPDSLQKLISIAPALALVGRTIGASSFWIGVLDMETTYIIARFFAEHEGHALEVADEYGYAWVSVQAYDGSGATIGEPKMCRLDETSPRASAKATML